MFTPLSKTLVAVISLSAMIIVLNGCSPDRAVSSEQAVSPEQDSSPDPLIEEINNMTEEFLVALGEEDCSRAYSLLAPELQQRIGDPASLEKVVEESQAHPSEWELTSSYILTPPGVEEIEAGVDGLLTYRDGRQGALEIRLIRMEGEWTISSFILSW